MNAGTVVLIVIALALVALALRAAWRAFIRATDREIEKEMDDLRRQGLFGGTRGDRR